MIDGFDFAHHQSFARSGLTEFKKIGSFKIKFLFFIKNGGREMAKTERNKPRKLPLSGDKLVDLFFKMVLDAIYYKISAIKKKKNLTNPDVKDPKERRKALYGLHVPDTKEVFLSASKCKHPTKMSMIPALIHEVFHEIMPDVFHRRIYQLENALIMRFTDAQKRYLRKFIPKHQVKTGPRPEE